MYYPNRLSLVCPAHKKAHQIKLSQLVLLSGQAVQAGSPGSGLATTGGPHWLSRSGSPSLMNPC